MPLFKLEGTLPEDYLQTEEGQSLKARLDSDAQIIAALEKYGFEVNFDEDDDQSDDDDDRC